jgi:hypothetical protein
MINLRKALENVTSTLVVFGEAVYMKIKAFGETSYIKMDSMRPTDIDFHGGLKSGDGAGFSDEEIDKVACRGED